MVHMCALRLRKSSGDDLIVKPAADVYFTVAVVVGAAPCGCSRGGGGGGFEAGLLSGQNRIISFVIVGLSLRLPLLCCCTLQLLLFKSSPT